MRRLGSVVVMMLIAGMSLFPVHDALAQFNDPKSLTAAPLYPLPDTKKPVDPNALPQEFVDMRAQVKAEYNAWMAADTDVQKQCDAARTAGEHALCDHNKQISQARLDAVNAHTREMQRKIDTWRRKQMGLPPPEWWPPPNQPTPPPPSTTGVAPKTAPSILVPQGSTPMPTGTY